MAALFVNSSLDTRTVVVHAWRRGAARVYLDVLLSTMCCAYNYVRLLVSGSGAGLMGVFTTYSIRRGFSLFSVSSVETFLVV